MTGRLTDNWQPTWREVWRKLAEVPQPPPDLYIQLFDTALDYLVNPPVGADYDVIHNDPMKARAAFLRLKGSSFKGEASIVGFFEAAYGTISDFGVTGLAQTHVTATKQFLAKFNLRYRIEAPFSLCALLPGSFSNLYSELQRINGGDPHLSGLLLDFEHAFDRYSRSKKSTDLKTCIAKASNYAEGVASSTHGTPGTLGALCNSVGNWPHDQVKESLQKLYKFCSDYPGIRHAGTQASKRRDLVPLDSTLVCLLLLSFSGYLSPLVNEDVVLGT